MTGPPSERAGSNFNANACRVGHPSDATGGDFKRLEMVPRPRAEPAPSTAGEQEWREE